MMKRKQEHVWAIAANYTDVDVDADVDMDVLAEKLNIPADELASSDSGKLVEFFCAKALQHDDNIADPSFARFTFDIMLNCFHRQHKESVAKEKHDNQRGGGGGDDNQRGGGHSSTVQDDIPLFYSDLMPLLVDDQPSVREDGFVWLSSLFPLHADIASATFTFETLTATTAKQLHFPAYHTYLKQIHKCIKHLQTQAPPTGVELGDDEFILHVEGTAGSQRVVRHIGGTSWPGRLTLTNYALYFEASGVISYEDALKIDLSKDSGHTVKPSSTGPWGAPLFDKAILYESPYLSEGVVLEFPEITSSTRRDHWLALIKEIMLLHRFLSKFKVESPTQAWEMHARTILGIIRLHAAREMLRISPPIPTKFLIFSLFDELPKGDYVLEEIAESLKNADSGRACSASSILRNLNMSQSTVASVEKREDGRGDIISISGPAENLSSLESVIDQVREEAKEVEVAKATVEGLKEEGIGESAMVLMELLSPLKSTLSWFQKVMTWKKPGTTVLVIAAIIVVAYKEWVGKAIAALLTWIVAKMVKAKQEGIEEMCDEIVVCTASDQTTMESIVSAQHGLHTFQDMVKKTNIAILKIRSILSFRAAKHAKAVMVVLSGLAIILAVVPFNYILIGAALHYFTMNSRLGKHIPQDKGDRRIKEWWDSIPVVPVKFVDKISECPPKLD